VDGSRPFLCRVIGVKAPRLTLAFCALAATAALAGCGGPSDADQVKELVNSYIQDFVKHDGKAMCSKLTPTAQKQIQDAAGMLRGRDCAMTLTTISRLPTGTQAAQVRRYRAGKVVVDGKEAGVIVVPSAPGTKPTRIVKLNGKWLIDGSVSLAG
jgi:hypothetical protein